MSFTSSILFQICKLQFEFSRRLADRDWDPKFSSILEWIGFKKPTEVMSGTVLPRKKDYVEDRVTVSLLLIAGSHKVCTKNKLF